MTRSMFRTLATFALGVGLLAAPAAVHAAKGDCGQPATTGESPSATDALVILRTAVSQPTACDDKPCICDINDSGSVNSTDALLTLRKAAGLDVTLTCDCGPTGLPCTSAEILTRPGSDLDSGWTGIAHDSDIILGASITMRPMRRCTDSSAECTKDSDCANNDCKATCDCESDEECEVTGPTHGKKCLTTLADCTTNADCPVGVACINTFGPPLPLSSGGTPVCVVSLFDGPVTGTADSGTGAAVISTNLKSRVFLGIALAQPCPRCGPPDQNPEIGDQFTCEGGQFPGAACTVEGLTEKFGGTSSACPPTLQSNISGSGLSIRFNEVTTGTTTKTAKLPCANFATRGNPLVPGSNPKCTDDPSGPVCTSNADCTRCTGDPSIECSTNGDCTGNGVCAQAPDQPITCGFWCNCGFCNNNPSLPCFETSECPSGQQCVIGTGTGTAQNVPQQKPNDCALDGNRCGELEEERCATTLKGSCSEQPYRNCNDDSTCISNDAGTCILEPRPCFEPRITRSGSPSPLGNYCAFENKTCTTNADCPGTGDFCAEDASRAQTVALFCVPSTSSSAVNSAGGITGPGAIRLNSFLQVCRCGDSQVGCDEDCDDGNTNNGDGCDDLCQDE